MAKEKSRLKEPHTTPKHNEEVTNGLFMPFDEAMRKISRVIPRKDDSPVKADKKR